MSIWYKQYWNFFTPPPKKFPNLDFVKVISQPRTKKTPAGVLDLYRIYISHSTAQQLAALKELCGLIYW